MGQPDQNMTVQALQAIEKNDWKRAENLIAQTRDRLATRLFYWLYYTNRGGPVQFERIRGFIKQNPDWPLQGRLVFVAEQAIPQDYPDEEVISWFYEHAPQTVEGAERFFAALRARGHETALKKYVREWWKEALVTPAQQARIYSVYSGYMDRHSHERRVDKLLFHRHYTNARKIADILGKGYPALVEARIALAEDIAGVDRLVASVPPHLALDPGLIYERVRWRRRHDKTYGAIEMLNQAPVDKQSYINKSAWWRERHILTRRLLETRQYKGAYELVSAHKQDKGFSFAQAEFLAGWIALRFTDEPVRAFEHFEALFYSVNTPISRSRGAYWAGRASEALGRPDIKKQWYEIAAQHQMSYYGQLAVGALGRSSAIQDISRPAVKESHKQAFEKREKVQIARLLSQAGFRDEASSFIRALSDEIIQPEEYLLLAGLSREVDHFHDAIRIAKKAVYQNIYLPDYAYPSLLSMMHDIETEWALLHALIRQESEFDYAAISPAGARGLMQLMPATAQEVARTEGTPHRTIWLTSNPKHNIRLGSAYLEQMLARYDRSYPLALAAYNAGPARVNRWLETYGDPRQEEISMIDWIELIPVYETRNYVQRVLENTLIYRVKFKDKQKAPETGLHVSTL